MNIINKFKIYFLAVCLLLLGLSTASYATDLIPLPPMRPDKMSVSPAYIEELRNREKQSSHNQSASINGDSINSDNKINDSAKNQNTIKTTPRTSKAALESKTSKQSLEESLVDISSENLVDILEGKSQQQENKIALANPPIPAHKPLKFNNIEPAAAPKNNNNKNENDDEGTTLISFVLPPEQIHLDKNLELFLKKHAVNMFNRDRKLKMKIQAYASEIEGQPHSDVRISLARALEVRSFLIDNNINPSRLKLSPEGKDNNNRNSDRIDLLFIKDKK